MTAFGAIMKLSKGIKKISRIPRVLVTHKCLRPKHICLRGSDHKIYINPYDDRAYKKLVIDSTTRRRETTPLRFWRTHNSYYKSGLFLDVGSNYGEFMASGRYVNSNSIAIEANPTLIPYLNRTRDDHPQQNRIHIVNALVASTDRKEASLYYSPKWTGSGSAVRRSEELTEAKIQTRTLDSILHETRTPTDGPLIFKMDIEGFEGEAFSGFKTIENFSIVVGVLEFDTAMLKAAKTEPLEFFNFLLKKFHIFLTHRNSTKLQIISDWKILANSFKKNDFHCDLVVVTDPNALAPGWETCEQSE